MPRLLILWFSMLWSSAWCSDQTQVFDYNTADARIFKGNDNQAYYYLAGSVYDMTADKWEHYPGGLAVIKKISSVYNLNLIIKDHLTNTRAIIQPGADNCSGSMTYESIYDYYPYGKILRKVEAPRSRFQSTDHETDLETGYNNRNARWYDDESFQFLQTDPVADVYPSLSPYNYVSRKPISFIDPTGMYETEADAEANRLSAMRLGYKVDDVYKSGKEYVFNISGFDIGDFATAKSRDFVEAAKDAFNQPVDPIRKALMSDQIWQLTYNRDFGRGYNASGALGEPPLNTFDIVTLGQGGSAMVKSFKTSTSLSTTAADLAASWQGKGIYSGVDKWRNITLGNGKYLVGGLPGQTSFYTTLKGLERSGLDKTAFSQGLQVAEHAQFGYRGQIGIYRVTGNTPAAFGSALANPQFGIGGLPQIFIPNFSGLQLIKTIPLK